MSERDSDTDNRNRVVLGNISGVYGLNGWVKVFSYTSPKENILNYPEWRLEKKNLTVNCRLKKGKPHGKGIVVQLEGYEDRNQAELLIKANISVAEDTLPDLGADEYYWRDLEGLQVFNTENVSYGYVDYMLHTGANDVVVVKGNSEILIPFVQGLYIKSIDLEKGQMIVDWPESYD